MRPFPSRSIVAALLAVFLVPSLEASDAAIFPRKNNPIVQAVQKTKHAVVTVRVPRPGGGKDMIGTGVVIDERGFIVTNRHVVTTNRHVNVVLHDGTELVGEVIVAEARWDLAVLRIRTDRTLSALTLGPKDLMVGETVIAVGHPYGYTNTVSVGIVSALEREITMPTGDAIAGLIQTDASINPGNSGGPLLNIDGELIGINVALREGAQGIAFAINTGTVERVLSKHLSALRLAGVNHGLRCTDKVTEASGDRQRVVITAGGQDQPLRAGDEIVTVGARKVANAFDVERALWDKRPGQQVELRVNREGRAFTVTLTLAAAEESSQVAIVRAEAR